MLMLTLRTVTAHIRVNKKVDAASAYDTTGLEESFPLASFQRRLRRPMTVLSNVLYRYIDD